MVFSSVQFIFLFLPSVLSLYLLVLWLFRCLGVPRLGIHAGNLIMLIASLLFYFIGEQGLVVIMIVSSLTDYTAGLLLSGAWRRGDIPQLPEGGPRSTWQRAVLVGALMINLGILFFFKYFNFSVDAWNQFVAATGMAGWGVENITRVTLPLGISFYTFQSMSYTIDVYRGHARATRNLLDFGCYVTMYPQLVAGPIVRYVDVAAALANRHLRLDQFVHGIARFLCGLGKKVLIANTVSVPVDAIFALPSHELSTPLAWIAVVGYALQIYFDFSGYSDMAIGLGRMLGFEFCENFAHPYSSRSLRDFWRRWHISLSTWFRDYLYLPLGGNRRGSVRTGANLLVVFLLCGLWHGAEWTFVIWGLWHGAFLAAERNGAVARWLTRHRLVSHVYTMLVVLVGWVLFRSESFAQCLLMLRTMVGIPLDGCVADSAWRYVSPDVAMAFVLGVAFSLPVGPAVMRVWRRMLAANHRCLPAPAVLYVLGTAATVMACVVVGLLCVCALAASTYNPFIYFRF